MLIVISYKCSKLHIHHFYHLSLSFKTYKNFTQNWLYLEIKVTLKSSFNFYFNTILEWICNSNSHIEGLCHLFMCYKSDCLGAGPTVHARHMPPAGDGPYSYQKGSLFHLNLKDHFMRSSEKMTLKGRICEKGEWGFQIPQISHIYKWKSGHQHIKYHKSQVEKLQVIG